MRYELDYTKAKKDLAEYIVAARQYREIKRKYDELRRLDKSTNRLSFRRKYAMWKTRYGFDAIDYINHHLDEDIDTVIADTLQQVEEHRINKIKGK